MKYVTLSRDVPLNDFLVNGEIEVNEELHSYYAGAPLVFPPYGHLVYITKIEGKTLTLQKVALSRNYELSLQKGTEMAILIDTLDTENFKTIIQ